MNVLVKIQKLVFSVVSSQYVSMHQIYSCFRCIKALAIVRINIVVSFVHNIGIFSLKVKKSVARVVSTLLRDFLALKHVLKTVHA